MAKQKRDKKNKLVPQKSRSKGDLVDDARSEHYELSEEFTKNNPLKTPPNQKNKKK